MIQAKFILNMFCFALPMPPHNRLFAIDCLCKPKGASQGVLILGGGGGGLPYEMDGDARRLA